MLKPILVAALLLITGSALAEPLRIDRSEEKMKVDGALREWRGAHFRDLGEGDDLRLRFALASADGGLYVALEVRDDALVVGRDVAILTLAMPRGKKLATSEIWLYPGAAGTRARAALSLDGGGAKDDARIQVVEGPLPRATGYVIEAFVPWSALAGSERWQEGRAGLRFVDVDASGPSIILRSTPEQRAADLPKIALGVGQDDMLGAFLEEQHLVGIAPRYDWYANVAGDARAERVLIINEYVVVFGPGFKNGESYSFHILPFTADSGGLASAALQDLTGDGISELLVRGKQRNDLGSREVWLVLELEEVGMLQWFGVELQKELSKGGLVNNVLTITPARGKQLPRIEQRLGRAVGLNEQTYRETPAGDLQPLLLPWGEVEARTFGWNGEKFVKLDERKNAVAQPSAATSTPAGGARPQQEPQEGEEQGGYDALIAAFKQQAQIPANMEPAQTVRANVLGGAAAERIDVFGTQLVLTGKDIGAGRSFVRYGVPVDDPRDVLEVRPADVTGDGQAELLLRVRQPLSGGAELSHRELLLVLKGDAQGRVARILLAEVARRQGASAIENAVQTSGGALTIAPGRARGWSQKSYPYDTQPSGGAERLLLPWADEAVRYRLQGGGLVAR